LFPVGRLLPDPLPPHGPPEFPAIKISLFALFYTNYPKTGQDVEFFKNFSLDFALLPILLPLWGELQPYDQNPP
jgi:hypothetical protein